MAPFPASSLTLEYFCIQASQQVSYKTLKVYLSGIRLANIERGLPHPTDSHSLHLVCRGICCQQGDSQRTRRPITINILRLLKEQLRFCTCYTPLEKCLLWAVFTLAFYRFFRASELLLTLTWSHIILFSNRMSIILYQSKTDPHLEVVKLCIFLQIDHLLALLGQWYATVTSWAELGVTHYNYNVLCNLLRFQVTK